MTDVIIAADNLDGKLGHFFQLCATDLHTAIVASGSVPSYRVTQMASADLTVANVLTAVQVANVTDFVFVVFSHGSPTALGRDCQDGVFIDTAMGVSHFARSLFYTFACSSGRTLGRQLVIDGCHSFWGYKDPAWVVHAFTSLCVDCANYGFKMLLAGNDAQTSYDMMLDKYTEAADYVESETDSFLASYFLLNRDNLVLHGKPSVTLNPWKT
jgi:hypothetical protein